MGNTPGDWIKPMNKSLLLNEFFDVAYTTYVFFEDVFQH